MFQLSPQQRAVFDAFGFLKLPGLFRAEIDTLAAAFDAVFAAHPPSMVISSDEDVLQRTPRAATRTYRHIIAPDFVEKSPVLRDLPHDPRVRAVVAGLVDKPFAYRASDGHRFHCDRGGGLPSDDRRCRRLHLFPVLTTPWEGSRTPPWWPWIALTHHAHYLDQTSNATIGRGGYRPVRWRM